MAGHAVEANDGGEEGALREGPTALAQGAIAAGRAADTGPRARRVGVALALGALALAASVLLLASDAVPALVSGRAHGVLGALPLVLVGVAALIHAAARRARRAELARALLLALAFFFWAGNQLCENPALAALLNDVAVAGFVLDVFLTVVGWPSPSPSE
jgi:hypothetical protein